MHCGCADAGEKKTKTAVDAAIGCHVSCGSVKRPTCTAAAAPRGGVCELFKPGSLLQNATEQLHRLEWGAEPECLSINFKLYGVIKSHHDVRTGPYMET